VVHEAEQIFTHGIKTCIFMVKAATMIAGIKSDNPVMLAQNSGGVMPVIEHSENTVKDIDRRS
jgi:hypothetical protein